MASASRVTVTDVATALHQGDAGPSGTSLELRNEGAGDIDLGGSGVTTGNGFLLKTTERVTLTLSSGEELWAISAAAANNIIHVLKTGE